MARLSFKITSCWYVLGILLDVDPDTLDIIRANNVELPNPQQKAHEMLRRWLDQSSHPTQESLANALRSVQKHDLMKEFYSELVRFFVHFVVCTHLVSCSFELHFFRVHYAVKLSSHRCSECVLRIKILINQLTFYCQVPYTS